MLTQNKHVVIGAKWAAEILRSRTEILARHTQTSAVTLEAACKVTYAAICELLELRRAWQRPRMIDYSSLEELCGTSLVIDTREVVVPELTGDVEPIAVKDVFKCYIITALVTDIERYLLNPYYPERSWDFLTASPLPNGDVLVINDGDYRICKFEQMVREGKASY